MCLVLFMFRVGPLKIVIFTKIECWHEIEKRAYSVFLEHSMKTKIKNRRERKLRKKCPNCGAEMIEYIEKKTGITTLICPNLDAAGKIVNKPFKHREIYCQRKT